MQDGKLSVCSIVQSNATSEDFKESETKLEFCFESYSLILLSYYNSSSVCVFVCSPTPPRSFDGSSPNLVGVCRWTSELPLTGSFLKKSMGQQVNGSNVTFSEQTTPGWDHTAAKGVLSKRHMASKSLIPVLPTSLSNSHILWSFDPMSYLGANYLMVQLTVEQVDMATNVCF